MEVILKDQQIKELITIRDSISILSRLIFNRELNSPARSIVNLNQDVFTFTCGADLHNSVQGFRFYISTKGKSNTDQITYDETTQTHKLIEINARWGANSAICLSIGQKQGINPMMLYIEALRDDSNPLRLQSLKPGMVGMSMIEDFLAIRKYLQMKRSSDTKRVDNPMPEFKVLIRSYWDTYIHKTRTLDYFTKAIIDDPKLAVSVYKRLIKMAIKDNGVFVPWGEINYRVSKK